MAMNTPASVIDPKIDIFTSTGGARGAAAVDEVGAPAAGWAGACATGAAAGAVAAAGGAAAGAALGAQAAPSARATRSTMRGCADGLLITVYPYAGIPMYPRS